MNFFTFTEIVSGAISRETANKTCPQTIASVPDVLLREVGLSVMTAYRTSKAACWGLMTDTIFFWNIVRAGWAFAMQGPPVHVHTQLIEP